MSDRSLESQEISLPWGAWRGDGSHTLSLPASWAVCRLSPRDVPALDSPAIERALRNPLARRSIPELAAEARRAVVAVDDLTRPTRAGEILNPLLDLLVEGGIRSEAVRIVVAGGAHAPSDPRLLEAKLGSRALSDCQVEIHDPHGDLADTGIVYGSRTLRLNRTFHEADLKLGISSVLPHPFAGFGGGAKLMLPGLADLDSTERSHKFALMGLRGGADLDQNRFRAEAETIARRVGFEFTICAVCNASREIAAVVAGDIVAAHREASRCAAEIYATRVEREYDCLILNSYPKDTDLLQSQGALVALKSLSRSPVRDGGVVVLTTAASDGVGAHELFGPGGRVYRSPAPLRVFAGRELWIYAPTLSESQVHLYFAENVRTFHTSQTLRLALLARLGPQARCAVAPCGPLQQFVA